MIAKLLARNEWIKTVRRPAFLVTVGTYAGLMMLGFSQLHFSRADDPERTPFALPGGWPEMIDDELAFFAAFFCAVILMLLVTGEFSWRTARQNVIDGLSKAQFFAGKLMLVPLLAVLFFVVQLGIGGAWALAGTDLGAADATLMRAPDAALLGGFLLFLLDYAALAYLAAILARSSGPAVALFFLYVAILETLVSEGVRRVGGAAAIQFLPTKLFNALLDPAQYDLALRERLIAAAIEKGNNAPSFLDTGVLTGVAGMYVVVLLAISFIVFKRRDL